MSEVPAQSDASCGKITEGVETSLVAQTLKFVQDELPLWRDDQTRPQEESEERLNAQLCKFLNVAAADRFPMIHFHHEEQQAPRRRVDISANPITIQFIGAKQYTIYEPFIVFEGKRLPAPSRDREQEYVTGGAEKSGGIQRFRLGLHGEKLRDAVMIGYVQNGSRKHWFNQINAWIDELADDLSLDDLKWSTRDRLTNFISLSSRTSSSDSSHDRVNSVSAKIRLRHYWVEMHPSEKSHSRKQGAKS